LWCRDTILDSEQRKITYVGWSGHNNVGDDALYSVTRSVFRPYRLIPDNKKQYSRITLFGGGTLLPRGPSLVLPNKYNYAYGAAVQDPSFWGDFESFPTGLYWIKKIKQFNFRYIGVRDKTSSILLKKWGVDSKLIGDPCLLLRPSKFKRERNSSKIAINIGSDGYVWGGDERRVFQQTTKLCGTLKKEGWNPILIPFSEQDIDSVERISKETNTEFLSNLWDIQEILNAIASCHVLIGEKLHSLVFSAAAHTPFISIEYRPKCYSFAETVGFEKYNIRTDEMTSQNIMMLLNDLLDNWSEMHRILVKNVTTLRKKLGEAASLIKGDIESLPEDKWSIAPLQRLKLFCHRGPYFILDESLRLVHELKNHVNNVHAGREDGDDLSA